MTDVYRQLDQLLHSAKLPSAAESMDRFRLALALKCLRTPSPLPLPLTVTLTLALTLTVTSSPRPRRKPAHSRATYDAPTTKVLPG